VSAFKGKNLAQGALAGFIAAVKQGKIKPGSYLVIEKLDRFSRDDADEALSAFTQLLKAGIAIVTLDPEKEWTAEAIKGFGIMELVLHFILSNQESQKKSERLGSAWRNKKRNAKSKIVTRQTPFWIVIEDGKAKFDPDGVKVIRLIFEMAAKGYGSTVIAKTLNRKGVKAPQNKSTGWHGSTVSKLLRSRQPIGEYQPYKLSDGPKKRVPDGEPVADYYPAAITKAQWDKVQKDLTHRRLARGKTTRTASNLFQGLVTDAHDGGLVRLKNMNNYPYLVNKLNERGLSEHRWSFSYSAFEQRFLEIVGELRPRDLVVSDFAIGDDWERLAEVEKKIEKIKLAMAGDGDFDSLLEVLQKLEKEKKRLTQGVPVSPISQKQDLADCQSVVEMLGKAKGAQLTDLRIRLRSLIRSLVESITILVEKWGDGRVCFAQVVFRGGGQKTLHMVSAGKGVTHLNGHSLDVAVGNAKQMPVVGPHDLRSYSTDGLVRTIYDGWVQDYQAAHPMNIALGKVKAGKKPYIVARELGIANSTVYRWVELSRA